MTLHELPRRKAAHERSVPVTVSLPAPMLEEVDRAVSEAPFGSRSDAVQAALIEFLSLQRARRSKNPSQLAVLAVCFNRKDEPRVAAARHSHGDVIRSVMHTHLEGEDCVEIFVATGPQAKVQALESALNALRGVHLVRRTNIPPHETVA